MNETDMDESQQVTAGVEGSPARKSRAVATYVDKRKMEDLMLDNSDAGPGPVGEQIWREGWDFLRVAQSVNPSFNADHAKRVAADLGLTFVDPLPIDPAAIVNERLEALEHDVRSLQQQLNNLAAMCMSPTATEYDNVDRGYAASERPGSAIQAGGGLEDGPGEPTHALRDGQSDGAVDRDLAGDSPEGVRAVG